MTEAKKPATSKRAALAANRLNAYRRLFSTEDGKEVLKDMMDSCHISSSVIGKDVNETYFNEGVRSVVLRIMGTVNMSTTDIERIIIEMNRKTEEYL